MKAKQIDGDLIRWTESFFLDRTVRPWMDSNRNGRESGGQETRTLCSGEHRVGQLARPPVRHCEDRSSTLHTQKRPQEAPPANTHSKTQCRRQLHPVQQRSDTVAGCMDGCPLDIQRASQPLHEEGQDSRRPTASTDEDAQNRSRAGKGHSNSLRRSCCTIRQHIIVGPERDRQTRVSSTPPQSAGQVNPGRSAQDATRSAHERFRTDTCASSPRLRAATIRGKARKRMRILPAKGDVQLPHIWCTDMQSHQERERTRPGGIGDALAPPGRRTGSKDDHTER